MSLSSAGCNDDWEPPALGAGENQCTPSWKQKGTTIDGDSKWGELGTSLSISKDGRVVAIGEIGNSFNGLDSGHVEVFEWNEASSSWTKRGLDIEGEEIGDQAGVSVSLSEDGTIVAIGADKNDGNGSSSGHVRVYKWNGTFWLKRGNDIEGEAGGDNTGRSVSLSNDGNVVAIGAFANYMHIYEWNDNNSEWSRGGYGIEAEAGGDKFGFSVDIESNGNSVAIGAYSNDGNGSSSGHVRVYERSQDPSVWIQRGEDIDGEAAGDRSGRSVSLSDDGKFVAIGAYGNDGNGNKSGHVRVYEWSNVRWIQRGGDLDGEGAGDSAGYSVSLSDDGKTVAMGSPERNSNSGHTSVYEWVNNAWSKRGDDIDATAAGVRSGHGVSLSGDGETLLIGAPLTNGNEEKTGRARIMTWDSCEKFVGCVDSNLRIKVKKGSKMISRSCKWVSRNTGVRCPLDGVNETCPSTCGKCERCLDSPLRFNFFHNDRFMTRSCKWAERMETDSRCNIDGMADTCRKTCGIC